MKRDRKQIRLKNYDYSKPGLYYVTICTQNRECIFGDIVVGVGRDRPSLIRPCYQPVSMILNQYGKIIKNIWESLPDHHSVELDAFQIMPNHVHFIIGIIMGASQTGRSRPTPTLGTIVGLFKSECTKRLRIVGATRGSPWQRNYYEHVIRNENELIKIREYIKNNPLSWNTDVNNPTEICLNRP